VQNIFAFYFGGEHEELWTAREFPFSEDVMQCYTEVNTSFEFQL